MANLRSVQYHVILNHLILVDLRIREYDVYFKFVNPATF